MGHNNFLEPTLILTLRINVGHIIFQPMLTFQEKISVGHSNYFPRKFMWAIIIFGATFVLQVIFNALVESLNEDLGKDPWP